MGRKVLAMINQTPGCGFDESMELARVDLPGIIMSRLRQVPMAKVTATTT